MSKIYYWRRSRANPEHLFIVFRNRENRCGISASVKPTDNGMWQCQVKKPFRTIEATMATQEDAQTRAEQSIDYEFRPEYIPPLG